MAAAALAVVGLLVGAGYAAGYVARNSADPVQQGPSEAQGDLGAPESSRPGTGTPGAPGSPGQGPGGPPTSAEQNDGGTTTISTVTTTTTNPTTTKPPAKHTWFLPPAGPIAPSGNEDVAYRSLNARQCGSVLDSANDSANGGGFDRERHGWLLVGNAHACLGNVQSAEQAADQAEQYAWPGGEPATVRQICALDKALLGYLNRPARPCGAVAAPTEDGSTGDTDTEPAP